MLSAPHAGGQSGLSRGGGRGAKQGFSNPPGRQRSASPNTQANFGAGAARGKGHTLTGQATKGPARGAMSGAHRRGSSAPRGPSTPRGQITQRGQTAPRARGRGRGTGAPQVGERKLSSTQLGDQSWRLPENAGGADYRGKVEKFWQSLKNSREKERETAVKSGLMSDPNSRTTLAEAITIVGTCQDMCPEFERIERIHQNLVDSGAEMTTNSSGDRVPFEAIMVKRFKRSAAGDSEQLPSDIRPPAVLLKTLNYLMDEIVGGAQPYPHKFVWDRTRAIRNDFSIQQVTKVEDLKIAIECFEQIARFHIWALHNGVDDEFQDREQLNNTLLSLTYYYDDSRGKLQSPNEPEFRAYCIIFEIKDRRPDLESRVQLWPKDLVRHQKVQTALALFAAACNVSDELGPLQPKRSTPIAQGNYMRFWVMIGSKAVSYLMGCAAEIYFFEVRKVALETIWRAYNRPVKAKLDDLVLSDVMLMLGFDTEDQTATFCEDNGFTIGEREDGQGFLDIASVPSSNQWLPDSKQYRRQLSSKTLVEAKRFGRTPPAVIKGYTVAQARSQGMLDEDADMDMADHEQMVEEAVEEPKEEPVTMEPTTIFGAQPARSTPSPFTQDNPFGIPQAAPSTEKTKSQAAKNPFELLTPRSAGTPTVNNPFTSKADGQGQSMNPFKQQPPISNETIAKGIFGTPSISPVSTKIGDASTSIDQPNKLALANNTAGPSNPFATLPVPANSVSGTQNAASSIFPTSTATSSISISEQPAKTSRPLFQTTFKAPMTSSVASGSSLSSTSTPSIFASTSLPGPANSIFETPLAPGSAAPSQTTPLFSWQSKKQDKEPSPQIGKSLSWPPKVAGKNGSPETPLFFPDEISKESTQLPPQPLPSSTAPAPTTTQSEKIASTNPVQPPNPSVFEPPKPYTAQSTSTIYASTSKAQPSSGQHVPTPPTLADSSSKPAVTSHLLKRTSSLSSAPVRPSPLRNEYTAPLATTESFPRNSGPQFSTPPQIQGPSPDQLLDTLVRTFALEHNGLLQQFIESELGEVVNSCIRKFNRGQERERARTARQFLLSCKYLRRWKSIAWARSLRRKSKQRRQEFAQSMQEMALSSRSNSRALSTSPGHDFEPFHSLVGPPKDNSMKPPPKPILKKVYRNSLPAVTSSPQRQVQTNGASSPSKIERKPHFYQHRRSQTTVNAVPRTSIISHRVSKPLANSTHSRFRGSSLNSTMNPEDYLFNDRLMKQASRLISGRTDTTRTDYFKLKALGIDPNTPVVPQTRKRRSEDVDGMDGESEARKSRESPARRLSLPRSFNAKPNRLVNDIASVNGAPNMDPALPNSPNATAPSVCPRTMNSASMYLSSIKNDAAAKATHGAASNNNANATNKTKDDDDPLFAELAAVRAAMADSELWFRSVREQSERSSMERTSETEKQRKLREWRPSASRTEQRWKREGVPGWLRAAGTPRSAMGDTPRESTTGTTGMTGGSESSDMRDVEATREKREEEEETGEDGDEDENEQMEDDEVADEEGDYVDEDEEDVDGEHGEGYPGDYEEEFDEDAEEDEYGGLDTQGYGAYGHGQQTNPSSAFAEKGASMDDAIEL